jgi:putative hydrolase of the HAD superfamily
MIKHLSFDLWGTLIQSNPNFKKKKLWIYYEALGRKVYFEKIEEELKSIEKLVDSLNEECPGHMGVKQGIGLVVNRLGVKPERSLIDKIFNELMEAGTEYPPIWLDDNIDIILRMCKTWGYTMNILSNTGFIEGAYLRERMRSIAPRIFNFMIFSDEIRASKPSHTAFSAVWERANSDEKVVHMSEILHIGDNPYTDGACVKVGMKFYDLTKHSIHDLLNHISEFNTSGTGIFALPHHIEG